ncbi:MAG: alpha/beta fold hydrolase [Acidimicrobiales bacterium]
MPLPRSVTERLSGSGKGTPVVVLVHGALDRAASFARVRRRLVDLPVVTYDRRGYHRSRRDGEAPAVITDHVEDLLEVIGGRPAVVVGHSLGGVLALMAACRPGGPDPVVSVAAYEPPLPWLERHWPDVKPDRDDRGESSPEVDPGVAAEQFFRRMVGDRAWERLPETAKQARRADGAALKGELDSLPRHRPAFDVSDLSIPVLYGRGECSSPRHRETVQWLADRTPGAVLMEIEGASHGAHLTHPDSFAGLVRSAWERVPTEVVAP